MTKKTPTFDDSNSLFTPDFWFESEKLKATLDQLEHFTRFGDLLILLIGEPLSGKTSILQKMQSRVTDSDLCVIKSHPLLSIQEILRRMRAAFNLVLTPDQAEHSVEQMHDYLAASIPEKNHRLVVIDDAEQLGKETLLELLKLVDIQRQRGESLVHFILAGEEPLLKSLRTIKRKKFPRAAYHRLKVHPTLAEEIPQILLEANVSSAQIELTDEKCQKIVHLSNGNIGKIKHSLDNLAQGIELSQPTKKLSILNKKQQEKKRSELEQKIDTLYGDLEDDNSWLMPVVIVLSIIAFGAYWYLQYQPEIKEADNKPIQRTIPSLRPPVEKVKLERQLAIEEKMKLIEQNLGEKTQQEFGEPETGAETAGNVEMQTVDKESNLIEELVNETVVKENVVKEVVKTEKTDEVDEAIDSNTNVIEQAASMETEVEALEQPNVRDIRVESLSQIKTNKEANNKPIDSPELANTPSGAEDSNTDLELNPTGQAKQILTWPSSHYTIQLLVVSEQQYFDRFKAKYAAIDYFWFNSYRNGKEVFFVISGHYATKDIALSEAAKLVKNNPKLSTWVKPVSLIHQDILAFKKK